jgi:putative SOS response-associated peptidase YedK
MQPVVRLDPDTGRRELAMMRWGLVPFWTKDGKAGYSTINTRAEAITTSAAYREAVKRRRFLVPMEFPLESQKTGHDDKITLCHRSQGRSPILVRVDRKSSIEGWKPRRVSRLMHFELSMRLYPSAMKSPVPMPM